MMQPGESPPFAQRLRARLSSWKVIGLFGGFTLVSQAILGAILHQVGSIRVLRLQTTLSPQEFAAIFDQLRAEHLLHTYATHYYLDGVHPVWYGLLLAALLSKALDASDAPPRASAVLWVPIVAGALDVVENGVHLHYLATDAVPTTGLVALGGLSAILKWTLVVVSLVAAAALGIRGRKRGRSGSAGTDPSSTDEGAPR